MWAMIEKFRMCAFWADIGSGAFITPRRPPLKSARDIALYNGFSGKSYTYVAAGDQGWRVVDVTNPQEPQVAFKVSATCDPAHETNCRTASSYASFRGVAVHPDPSRQLMAMTDNYFWPDGNHYGYVRFYGLGASETDPPVIGREKLAEAYSGIPVTTWASKPAARADRRASSEP